MSTLTPLAGRPYSTRELQAAAAALAAGQFATTTGPPTHAQPDVADLDAADAPAYAAAGDDVDGLVPPTASSPVAGLEPLVRVRAATAGAGASTITLALADAADTAGVRTRVLDAAAPAWSGLHGATATELGVCDGWRRGRRGINVLIDRVEERVRVPAAVPVPRSAAGIDLTVLDAGWSMRELAASTAGATAGAGTWLAVTPAGVEVLVTRADELALSQTEAVLADLEEQPDSTGQLVVVVVGATRWSGREAAAAGRRLRDAHEQEAVLFAPLVGAKALPRLGPDPLPRQLTTTAQRLLERITIITGPLTANRD